VPERGQKGQTRPNEGGPCPAIPVQGEGDTGCIQGNAWAKGVETAEIPRMGATKELPQEHGRPVTIWHSG